MVHGVHAPPPLSLYLTSRKKLWCTLQLGGQIHSPYIYSTPTVYVLCEPKKMVVISMVVFSICSVPIGLILYRERAS